MILKLDINDLSEAITGERVIIKWYADEVNPIPQVDIFDGHVVLNRVAIEECKKETEGELGLFISKVEVYGDYKTVDQNGFDVTVKVLNEDALGMNYDNVLVNIIDAD